MPRLDYTVTRDELYERVGLCRVKIGSRYCKNRAVAGGLFCAAHGGLAASKRAVVK